MEQTTNFLKNNHISLAQKNKQQHEYPIARNKSDPIE
jgi:hypothetical protein